MCGFVGFSNIKRDLSNSDRILEDMNKTMKKRGPDEEGYYINNHIAMAHRRLIVIDPTRRQTTYDYYIRRKRILYYL